MPDTDLTCSVAVSYIEWLAIVVGACVEELKRCDVVCGVAFLGCLARG